MTLKLAAFQHFCARFADAFLTSLNPLTYESGDALQAFEEENEVHEPAQCLRCRGIRPDIDEDSGWCSSCLWAYVPPPAAVVTHDHAAGVEAPTPPAAFKLPMYRAFDLEQVALEYINNHRLIDNWHCQCRGWSDSGPGSARVLHNHAEHVAELLVSALTFELQGLAYDQSHPETQK